MFSAVSARAQYSADRPVGSSAQQAPAWQKNAGIDQNLNRPLPLSDSFKDESGHDVKLGDFFHDNRPVMLALVYYNCQMLCPQVLHGMASALHQSGFRAGHEYDVVVASIDPSDKPADAVSEKQHFLSMLDDSSGSAAGAVHFLTGPESSITDLAQATGFHYVRVPGPDGKMDQFAHSSVIMIATPDGRMSKYLFGVDYQPRDVRLALIQASTRHIGTLSDLLYGRRPAHPRPGRNGVAAGRDCHALAAFKKAERHAGRRLNGSQSIPASDPPPLRAIPTGEETIR